MLPKRYCWFVLALIFLIACGDLNTDSEDATDLPQETTTPIDTISAPKLTPTNAIPTSIPSPSPTSTSLAIGDIQEIVAATATPLPEELQPPFPDSFLNLAGTQHPLFSCAEPANLGQIWFSRYPYETAEQYAARETMGFYEPTLSPNGEWLVMVAVDIENLNETTQSNGSWRFYDDSIWLMRSDGSIEPQQISSEFVRAEFSSAESNSCTVTARIERVVGWSPDGKWLAFIVSSPDEDSYSPDLYVLNMETFEQTVVASDVNTAVWTEGDGSSLLFHSFTSMTVTIASLNEKNINFEDFNLPQQVTAQYQIWNTQYDLQSQSILIRGKEGSAPFNTLFSFWQLDISTGTWQALTNLNSSPIYFVPHSNWALRCSSDSQNIPILERTTWEVIGNVEVFEGWRCDFSFWRDGKGNQVVSITSDIDREKIWASLIESSNYVLEQIVDVANFEIPDGYEIVGYAWKQ